MESPFSKLSKRKNSSLKDGESPIQPKKEKKLKEVIHIWVGDNFW
jgi:hypothetical protein